LGGIVWFVILPNKNTATGAGMKANSKEAEESVNQGILTRPAGRLKGRKAALGSPTPKNLNKL